MTIKTMGLACVGAIALAACSNADTVTETSTAEQAEVETSATASANQDVMASSQSADRSTPERDPTETTTEPVGGNDTGGMAPTPVLPRGSRDAASPPPQ